MSTADAIAHLKEQSASARTAVMEALEVGLGAGAKRKAAQQGGDDPGPSSSSGGITTTAKQSRTSATAAAASQKAAVHKSKALDALLGDLSDDSDEDEDA
jgi:hypothetical protein